VQQQVAIAYVEEVLASQASDEGSIPFTRSNMHRQYDPCLIGYFVANRGSPSEMSNHAALKST